MSTEEQIVEAIIHQLDKRHGIFAEPVSDEHLDPPLRGVNVWKHELNERYPIDTAWVSDGTVAWGPNFDYELPDSTPPAELADRIAETLKPRE